MTTFAASAAPKPELLEAGCYEEARRHERFAANQPAQVRWKSPDKTAREIEVRVVNVSAGGMAFLSAERLDKGVWVEIEIDRRKRRAIVRHAREAEGAYAIGVELFPDGGPLERSLWRLGESLSKRWR